MNHEAYRQYLRYKHLLGYREQVRALAVIYGVSVSIIEEWLWEQEQAQAAISFVAAGTQGSASSGNITPGLPSGWAADDIHVCLIGSADNVNSTMPAGWTAWDAGTNNTSALRTTVFWRRAVAGDTDPLITHTAGGTIKGVIAGYRGCITSGDPADVLGATTVNASSTTMTFSSGGITTIADNDMVVELAVAGGNITSSTYTGSPTPTERFDTGGQVIAEFSVTPPGGTGSRASTISAAKLNNGYLVALKPPSATLIPNKIFRLNQAVNRAGTY